MEPDCRLTLPPAFACRTGPSVLQMPPGSGERAGTPSARNRDEALLPCARISCWSCARRAISCQPYRMRCRSISTMARAWPGCSIRHKNERISTNPGDRATGATLRMRFVATRCCRASFCAWTCWTCPERTQTKPAGSHSMWMESIRFSAHVPLQQFSMAAPEPRVIQCLRGVFIPARRVDSSWRIVDQRSISEIVAKISVVRI